MKKTIFRCLAFLIAVSIFPAILLIRGFGTSPVYADSFYGELSCMVSRLKTAQKNKIVIIGNSSVPFGIDSALIEEELALDDLDYEVCNFGLYGAVGTKAMLDLSEKYIREGDIVIFTPELNSQAMSLYFSGTQMWYAVDSDYSLLADIKNKGTMIGTFPAYVAEKSGSEAFEGDGVYAKASFDEHCDMKNANREGNIMVGGYDANSPLSFDIVWDDEFVEYVNEYYRKIQKKGATMVYQFAPMNESAMPENYEQAVDDYYKYLSEILDFRIIGNPHDSVMECEWFYDSNVHLNSAGMQARTISIINDLKLYFEKITPVMAKMPSKPSIIQSEEVTEEVQDPGYFIYETNENGLIAVGLTEEGKKQTKIVIPSSIYAFSAETFQNNQVIEEVVISPNIKILYDNSFYGCTSLKKLTVSQENPEKIAVGYSLLAGAEHCKIYVTENSFSVYSVNYYWGHYADKLEIN